MSTSVAVPNKPQKSKSLFTPEEEKRIQAGVEAYQKKERENMIEEEIRNRIAESRRQKTGSRY